MVEATRRERSRVLGEVARLRSLAPKILLCPLFLQLLEPVLLLGKERFAGVDIRVRVKGGGHVAQIYGESQERGIGVGGGSESKALLLGLHEADPPSPVFSSQQSASPSPKPWWPITRNVSENGSFLSGGGGGGAGKWRTSI